MEEKRYITMRHFEIKKKIIPLGNLEGSLISLDDQKNVNEQIIKDIPQHNQDSLVRNYKRLEQKTRQNEKMYKKHSKEMQANHQFNIPFNKQQLTKKYNELLDENIKNLSALKTFLEISLLENPIFEFSEKICQVSTNITKNLSDYQYAPAKYTQNKQLKQKHTDMVGRGMVKSWEWVEGMVRCSIVHIRHASKHCQYHAELHSLIKNLKEERTHVTSTDQSYNDSCSSSFRLAEELKTMAGRLRELGGRVVRVGMEAMQVVPIRLRTQASIEPIPATVICDYVTPEIDLKEGDEVDVVDRSNLYRWGVVLRGADGGGQSATIVTIPSILLVVAGTDLELQASVDLMYEEHGRLVRGWRRAMEGRVVRTMVGVFKKKYSHVEEMLIKTLDSETKRDLLAFFTTLKEAMAEIKDPELAYEVNELQARLNYIGALIGTNYCSINGINPQENGIRGRVLIVQLNTLHLLLENFKDFSEACRGSVDEASKARMASQGAYKSLFAFNKIPRVQDDLISVQHVIKRLDHIIAQSGTDARRIEYSEDRLREMSDKEFLQHIRDLSNFMGDYEGRNLDNQKLHLDYGLDEELNELIDEVVVGNDVGVDSVDGQVEEEEREGVKISETEHMYAAECEENKKFVITAVVDPESKQQISLAEAIERKVVDAEKGSFLVDAVKMTRIPIAAAMAQNLIKVQSIEVNKSCERKLSVGLVTIKTTHHVTKQRKKSLVDERTVLAVMDLKRGRQLSWRQATKEGVIDKEHFIDTRDHSMHTLDQAEHNGWIKRSRVSSPSITPTSPSSSIPPPDVIPEVKTTTYAVRQVMDRRSSKLLSFMDACKEGLLDRDSAVYFDPLSDRKHSIEEAIELGYVQAEQVSDLKSIQLWQ